MKQTRQSLYGNVPDRSPVVLLLIDGINDLDFVGSQSLLKHALPMAKRLGRLKALARRHSCAAIYVNDNFGRWRSDFKNQVEHCLRDGVPGKRLVELLRPADDDYFVIKPAYSGFFSTTLDLLLQHLEAKTLIITGIATNICVLFTANDAYLRGYDIHVPGDCVAANSVKLSHEALGQMKSVLKAKIGNSSCLPWSEWMATQHSAEQKDAAK